MITLSTGKCGMDHTEHIEAECGQEVCRSTQFVTACMYYGSSISIIIWCKSSRLNVVSPELPITKEIQRALVGMEWGLWERGIDITVIKKKGSVAPEFKITRQSLFGYVLREGGANGQCLSIINGCVGLIRVGIKAQTDYKSDISCTFGQLDANMLVIPVVTRKGIIHELLYFPIFQ